MGEVKAPQLVVLGTKRKQVEQGLRRKSVNSTPPWPLPQDSCPTSFSDGQLTESTQCNDLSPSSFGLCLATAKKCKLRHKWSLEHAVLLCYNWQCVFRSIAWYFNFGMGKALCVLSYCGKLEHNSEICTDDHGLAW